MNIIHGIFYVKMAHKLGLGFLISPVTDVLKEDDFGLIKAYLGLHIKR